MQQFIELLKKDKKLVIGLMSGTSVDGIDTAIVEITGHGLETEVELIAFETFPFPPGVPQRILSLCHPDTGRVDDICEMNFYIGHLFAEAVKHILQKSGMRANDIALIGSHGQTIHHLPGEPNTIRKTRSLKRSGRRIYGKGHEIPNSPHRTARNIKKPSTLQIGEPAVIAHETGIPTIADFRVADMAAGGQGAPLVSYPDYLLFRDSVKTVGLLNIGGIANLTVLPANGTYDTVCAADTGPGNMCIDAVISEITKGAEHYDKDGKRAAQGTAYQPLIDEWLKHPFFQLPPPKTTGREMFGHTYAMECLEACREHELSDNDCIATLTELTVQTIADYIAKFVTVQNPIDTLYVSGGGVHNQTIMRRLGELLSNTAVEPVDNSGISADAKEAIALRFWRMKPSMDTPEICLQRLGHLFGKFWVSSCVRDLLTVSFHQQSALGILSGPLNLFAKRYNVDDYLGRENRPLEVLSHKDVSNLRVICCPALLRITCLGWMSETVVSASSLSPGETMCVLFPTVVRMSACGGISLSLEIMVPVRR